MNLDNNDIDNSREQIIARQYKILGKIGKGRFGVVFQGINIKTEELVAIKTERKKTPYKLLKNETTILKYLYEQGSRNIPIIYWYGLVSNKMCTVFTYFTLSLHEYIEKINKSDWNISKREKKANEIMVVCIAILESVHNNLVIHRDIKPQNFMFKDGELYLIDFGLSTFYVNDKGQEFNETKCSHSTILGTPLYASYYTHLGLEHSRRDDLISLGYSYLYMLYGELVWSIKFFDNYKNNTLSNNILEESSIMHPHNIFRKEKKSLLNIENLNINENIKRYFNYCYNLDFKGSPKYLLLQNLFTDGIKKI